MIKLYNIYKSLILEEIEDDYEFDDYDIDDESNIDDIGNEEGSEDDNSDYDEVYGDKVDDGGEDELRGKDYDTYSTGQYAKPLPPDEVPKNAPSQSPSEEPTNVLIGKKSNVSVENIKKAIDDKFVIKITYADGKSRATGDRWIEVVGYGLVRGTDNPVIRAYQLTGDSHSKKKTKEKGGFKGPWRLFRLDRIKSWEFAQKIKNPEPNHGFNPNGDNSMSVAYKIAKY